MYVPLSFLGGAKYEWNMVSRHPPHPPEKKGEMVETPGLLTHPYKNFLKSLKISSEWRFLSTIFFKVFFSKNKTIQYFSKILSKPRHRAGPSLRRCFHHLFIYFYLFYSIYQRIQRFFRQTRPGRLEEPRLQEFCLPLPAGLLEHVPAAPHHRHLGERGQIRAGQWVHAGNCG